ncbi:MAG TPA: FGGY family carbohydrate kinase [Cyclobacteriaceae bacterium]|jgi:sugar (pentulose or hexulose) kinase|nr:carbohydrate kinase [Cytophagales bacterium]HMR56424.1 FGGY family carbohydrate kinase [Cyclobacteriaceae bacterium]HRE66052.1 FGGY family carbohydrate kinase [Cyclobacteriaceae bacterium]HRF32258.1 FGGY family carbohydrate kinase [Cyclobacteriaceae bacterium]
MSIPVIAIFDIGKTNKKLFLFDEDYHIRFEKSIQLSETKDEDGFPCEDIHLLTGWVKQSFNEVVSKPDFTIKALNVSAYGASFVHIDESGKPVTPLYNYLKPYPEALKQKFYDQYGGESEFAKTTASPVLGNLNSGMQLYWLKHQKPDIFKSIRYSLHLPEYISYLFTQNPVSGITSIGCHTNLWDFTRNQYHQWVSKEEVADKLAPVFPAYKTVTKTFGKQTISVGIGLHDSSAALIPYLAGFTESFVLLSTGTWCISLNPFNSTPLTANELEQDSLCYLSYQGNPVKASRLFAGQWHEDETLKMAAHFKVTQDSFKKVKYNVDLIKKLNSIAYQQGHFTNYTSFDEAYTHFMIDLVNRQVTSTKFVLNSDTKCIFVDGGFSHNPLYMNLLARAFPNLKVFAASVAQATAIGAAMAIHNDWNDKKNLANLVQLIAM